MIVSSARPPVDLSAFPGFLTSPPPRPNAKGKTYFYGQATNGEGHNTVGEGVPILKWVATAAPKVLTLDAVGLTIQWPNDEDGNNLFESFRITHVETIVDPDNSDNSVDVDVIDQMGVKKKSEDKLVTWSFGGGGV